MTAQPAPPISNGLKHFLNTALPKDKGGHVLAGAEAHEQTQHLEWTRTHLKELSHEHNVGTLASELSPFMDVFIWAYRDGKLPVPKGKEDAYLHAIYKLAAAIHLKENAISRADLSLSALDPKIIRNRGIDIIHFDSRDSYYTLLGKQEAATQALNQLFAKYPTSRANLRNNPTNMDKLGEGMIAVYPKALPDIIEKVRGEEKYVGLTGQVIEVEAKKRIQKTAENAFLLLELQDLLNKNKKYKRWLDNIEAVIKAGEDMGKDALSAAILKASADPKKNIISNSGLSHVMGVVDDSSQVQGTFAQHLDRMRLKTTAVNFASSVDIDNLEPLLTHGGILYKQRMEAGYPTLEVPEFVPFGVSDTEWAKFQTSLDAAKQDYADEYATQPRTQICDAAYFDRIDEKLKSTEMKTALEKLAATRAEIRQHMRRS